MDTKKKISRYIVFRMGREWHKLDLFEVIANLTGKSKGEITRLYKQKGLDIYIDEE